MSLETRVVDLATQIATDIKDLRVTRGTMLSLTTTDKSSLVAALNELNAAIATATSISDGTTTTSTTWSSTKITSSINTAIAALVASAPAALDTLQELATALGNDPNFAASISTALGLRVRVDAAQAFDGTQQAQGRANIGAASATALAALTTAVGDTEADFAASYVATRDAV